MQEERGGEKEGEGEKGAFTPAMFKNQNVCSFCRRDNNNTSSINAENTVNSSNS